MFRFVIIFILLIPRPVLAEAAYCSYSTYKWNVYQRQAVAVETVKKPYSEIGANEIDAGSGCTVCEEDQLEIALPGLTPFKLCKKIAAQFEQTLLELLNQNAPINKIVGYRVGMTRGDVDRQGNRTQFSNHSFGLALDINPQLNGLYENCIQFGPQCRLRKGGHWNPVQPGSLIADGLIVIALKKLGLRWGGEIEGKQKDFMHFSPTGY